MRPFFVYILLCKDGSFYVGHTDNIEMRLSMHEQGLVDGYTKTRLPVRLVFLGDFGTRDEALLAERQIKGWSRNKKKALIAGDWNKIIWLSNYKKKSSYPSTSSGRTGKQAHSLIKT